MTLADRKLWLRLLAVMVLAVPASQLYALGLGEATVRSYMRQPLDVRIRLISRSEAELASVSAGLASAEDFRVMGLDRSMITVPMDFSVSPALRDPYIQIRSAQPINDPVVQVVVEVVWSSGRMLRQYTLFLDPPTFESAAPPPRPTPARADPEKSTVLEARDREVRTAAPDETERDIHEVDTGPPFEPQPEAVQILPKPAPEQDTVGEGESAIQTERQSGPEPQWESEPITEPEPGKAPEEPALRAVNIEPDQQAGVYGPVQRGETLWGIASDWGRQQGYGTNQVMLAIQQQNPAAFLDGNINLLKRGAILRLPDAHQINAWSARQAMLEVMRQDDLWRNRGHLATEPAGLPTVANIEPGPDTALEGTADSSATDAADLGRLELVPPTGPDAAEEAGLGQGNSDDDAGTNGESVVEELARTQEELANAQQENTYLNERIRELEDELAHRAAAAPVEVADTGLAEMEQGLRDERLSGEPREPLTLIPPREGEDWYSRYVWWLTGALLVVIAALVWWLRGRSTDGAPDRDVAHTPKVTPPSDAEPVPEDLATADDKVVELGRFKSPVARLRSLHQSNADEEAIELDSRDPETKLDLARAYLSMGDSEAARSLLEEVLEAGSKEQAREAQKMLGEL